MSVCWMLSDILYIVFFFKQKTAYEMRISDWSSDVCSSDLARGAAERRLRVIGDSFQVGAAADEHDLTPDRADEMQILERPADQIGRASCRERVCQYV